MFLTSDDNPHIKFLKDRDFNQLNPEGTKWHNGKFFVGIHPNEFNFNLSNTIILKKKKENDEHILLYKGSYPFDMPEFCELLFKKLRVKKIDSLKIPDREQNGEDFNYNY